MKFRRQVGTVLFACFLSLAAIATAHDRSPIELAQANVAAPTTQRESGWDPQGQFVGSPPINGHAVRCFSDSDCPNGFPCQGAQPDQGRDGLCGYSGSTNVKAVHIPLTPHPSCLVDADCDPGRRCGGNQPAMGVRGQCVASDDAPRVDTITPNPPK